MADLIDTTQMYLRTVLELEEEGVVPLRARIVERLGQSGPTVSETVSRMERDGLIRLENNRRLVLTSAGREHALRVMRKHRLAECLLMDVIGLDIAEVHTEACRWEHVISDEVERRMFDVLGHPQRSPYGKEIPGLDELDPSLSSVRQKHEDVLSLAEFVAGNPDLATKNISISSLGESVQNNVDSMKYLASIGVAPGAEISVEQAARIPSRIAQQIFIFQ